LSTGGLWKGRKKGVKRAPSLLGEPEGKKGGKTGSLGRRAFNQRWAAKARVKKKSGKTSLKALVGAAVEKPPGR